MSSYFSEYKKGITIALAVFIVLMIAPAAFVGIYYQTYNSLTTQEVTKEQTLSDLASLALKIKLDILVGIASSLASSQKLASAAADHQWMDAADTARDLENNVSFYDPFIDRVIVYDASGTQQAAYPALIGGLGTNASTSAWYKALIGGGQSSYVTNVTKRISVPQIQVVNIATPIKASQKVVGFLVLQIPTDNFLQFGENLDLGTYGFAYIVDPSGNIIAHPKLFSNSNNVANYSSVPEVRAVMTGNEGTDIIVDKNSGEKSIVTYKPVDSYGWGIITQQLYSEAFSTRSGILFELKLLITIVTVINLLIAYAIFRILTSRNHEK